MQNNTDRENVNIMRFSSFKFVISIAGIFLACLNASEASDTENKPELQIPPGFEMLKGAASDSKGRASEIRHKATGIEMVYVAPGVFMMGSPSSEKNMRENETQHKVKLTKAYYIGKYEVTQEQWKKVTGKSPSKFKGTDLPVEQVTWDECRLFCKKLNGMAASSDPAAAQELNTDGGCHFRLPSEAEWEYAARGGNRNKGFIYSGGNNLDKVGWYYENSGDSRLSDSTWGIDKSNGNNGRTHPVGRKSANELGIYDMSGNIWEWCSDLLGDYPAGEGTDPSGAATGSQRVHRGGGWYGVSWICRSAARSGLTPDNCGCYLGLRIVLDIPESAATDKENVNNPAGK